TPCEQQQPGERGRESESSSRIAHDEKTKHSACRRPLPCNCAPIPKSKPAICAEMAHCYRGCFQDETGADVRPSASGRSPHCRSSGTYRVKKCGKESQCGAGEGSGRQSSLRPFYAPRPT